MPIKAKTEYLSQENGAPSSKVDPSSVSASPSAIGSYSSVLALTGAKNALMRSMAVAISSLPFRNGGSAPATTMPPCQPRGVVALVPWFGSRASGLLGSAGQRAGRSGGAECGCHRKYGVLRIPEGASAIVVVALPLPLEMSGVRSSCLQLACIRGRSGAEPITMKEER
jgi:hypothetical protein